MPIAGSFSGASARGTGEFNLLQDSNASVAIYAVSHLTAATPSSPSAGSCTYSTLTPHFLQVGWSVTIANVGGATGGSFNGTFTVTAVTPLTFRVSNSVTGTATLSTNGITATVRPPSTWVCPPNVYSVDVLAIGAGGGGGSVVNTGDSKTPTYTYTAGPRGGNTFFGEQTAVEIVYFASQVPNAGQAEYIYGTYPGAPTITTGMTVTVTGSSVPGVNITNATVLGTGNDGTHQIFYVANNSSTASQYLTAFANAYVVAGGGSGQTQGTGSGQTLSVAYPASGGTAIINGGNSSSGGYSGGQGVQGGGGAGGYAGAGGSSQDNSTFTISTTTNSTSQTAPSPPFTISGAVTASLVTTSTSHNYSVGEIVNISGVNTTFSTTITSLVSTSTALTLNVTSGGTQFLAGDYVTFTGLTDYVSGSTSSIATTLSSKNATYTATNNFVAGQLVQLGGASSVATITRVGATTSLITYTCSNSLTTGQLVTIRGLSRSAYNITGFVSSASATQFTIAGSGFTTLTAATDSGSVYQGHGNEYITVLSATSSTFVVNPNGNNVVTGTACGTARTITPSGTIKATFAAALISSAFVSSSTSTTIVCGTVGSIGTLPSQSGTVTDTPTGIYGDTIIISTPATNQFYAYKVASGDLRAGTGGTVVRNGQNGSGGSGGSGSNAGVLRNDGAQAMFSGGGAWISGYVAPNPYNGYVGTSVGNYMGGSSAVPIISAVDNGSGSTAVFTVNSDYPVSNYITVGESVQLAGLTSSFVTYNGSAMVTAATGTTFSIASTTSATGATAQSAFAWPTPTTGKGITRGVPASASTTGGAGGIYGGGGSGPRGSGGGGALAWANGISVVPGRSYNVSPGAGGQASIGTNTYYFTDGGGGHGVVRIMYGPTKAWPTTNVS